MSGSASQIVGQRTLPAVMPLGPAFDAADVFRRLASRKHVLFLDSARRDSTLARYSFVAADPFALLTAPADGSDGLQLLADHLAPFVTPTIAGLPPFQGGAAGIWSYDLNRSLEAVPAAAHDEFRLPALAIGLYDVVVAFDHEQNEAWIISQGFPELEPQARADRAWARAEEFRGWINGYSSETLGRPAFGQPDVALAAQAERLPCDRLARQTPIAEWPGLTSSFSREAYLSAVVRAIEYIRAGDIFQVNLAQRLLMPATTDCAALYLRLRQRNPAPFAGYFDGGDFQIASASPERFLKCSAGEVETRPIKGTRGRSQGPEADLFAGDELEQSEKDRAENVMIVDLLRNDLSRVCRPESVRVTQLCRLENFEYVQHLVSAVCGRLRPGIGPVDLLRATFPGGSITGAPKVRAMEIIAELEPTARGPYCGALGYLGFDGTLDTNLLIRTITAAQGWWQAPVGGGIVAQSHPDREYEETWHKAAGLLQAMLEEPAK